MCMKTMPTRVILSHIVYGAKPCYDDKKLKAEEDDEDKVVVSKTKRKRKRLQKK